MILVLAGTRDAREVITLLREQDRPVMASVVTDYGRELLSDLGIMVLNRRLDRSAMEELIKENEIDMIIDATHPFAREVSRNAITVTKETGVKYIRFEREEIGFDENNFKEFSDLLIKVDGYREAAKKAGEFKRILLTIGSNNLNYFVEGIDDWQDRLIARVLPDWHFIKKTRELGFSPANIIAIQGPFSKELNRVLLADYKIEVLVTKASGKTGGLDTKLEAASELGIPVILIKRPELVYDKVVRSTRDLMDVVNLST